MNTFEELTALIPSELLKISGAVFSTGSLAFNSTAKLYVLGLNPGGAPDDHVEETVENHTQKMRSQPLGWNNYRDQSWNGRAAGTAPLQRRVLHTFRELGLDPGRVPMSNLIFKRTTAAVDVAPELNKLTDLCWPFHQTAIEKMNVRIVLCFGQDAANRVRTKLEADTFIDQFVEENRRGYKSTTYANRSSGISVIAATHPSRFDWCNPASDPTPLVKRALDRLENPA